MALRESDSREVESLEGTANDFTLRAPTSINAALLAVTFATAIVTTAQEDDSRMLYNLLLESVLSIRIFHP